MIRALFVPALLLACAGWCWVEATDGDNQTIAFSFIDALLPSVQGDPVARGKASAGLLAILGAVLGLNGLRRVLGRRAEVEEGE